MNKIDRLPQTVFVDPEKVKSVHIGTERIQLSKKDKQIMARYCYDLSAYLEHDRSETQILEKSKPKILIRKR